MPRNVRDKIDALAYVEAYFFEGDERLFSQWVPRFYYFCAETLWRLPAYASLFVFPFWVFPSQKYFFIFWLTYGAVFVLKPFVLRSVCANLLVVTQQAVYLYFRLQEERVDEFRWDEVETITFRVWRFAPSFATVKLRKHRNTKRFRAIFENMKAYRNRYKRPEKLNFRYFALKNTHSLRLVVRNHGELYERCRQLQQTEGYTFLLKRKGKPYAKCNAD